MTKELKEAMILAMTHTGNWTWWAHKFPEAFQIEFDRTMLFVTQQRAGIAPSGKIAIRFIKPLSVTFLQFSKDIDENWANLFHEDKLGPFDLSPDAMAFDAKEISTLVKTAKRENKVHGCDVLDPKFDKGKVKIAFKAGDVGLAVSADEIAFLSTQGLVETELIPAYHEKWLSYCEEYWERKGSKKEMPIDLVCEICGPVKESGE